MIEITEQKDAVLFSVRVLPRSSKTEIVGEFQDALKVKLKSPPVDGAANKELIKLFSTKFGVAKSEVEIVSGEASRTKRLRIHGLERRDILRKL